MTRFERGRQLVEDAIQEEVLTVAQLARLTGTPKKTIWRWVADKVITVERVGPYGRVRIRRAEAHRLFPHVQTLAR